MDACVGAMGFIHGPLDLDILRDIDSGKKTANEAFSHAGISKIASVDSQINNVGYLEKALHNDKKGLLAIRSLVMSVIVIYGLYGIMENKIDGIVLRFWWMYDKSH